MLKSPNNIMIMTPFKEFQQNYKRYLCTFKEGFRMDWLKHYCNSKSK